MSHKVKVNRTGEIGHYNSPYDLKIKQNVNYGLTFYVEKSYKVKYYKGSELTKI